MKEKQHIEALTGLKGIFILFIVLTHTLPDTPLIQAIPLTSFIRHYAGTWANSVFFMLSGYLLSMGYRDRICGKTIPFGTYLKKRLIKIYPMYILSNLVMIPFHLHSYGLSSVSLRRIALVALMQSGGGLDNEFPFNGSSWFVCTLMVCYVLYYFISFYSENRTRYRCYLTAGVVVGYILVTRYLNLPFCYNENGYAYINFFTGCLLNEIIPEIPRETTKKIAMPALLALGCIGFLMLRRGVPTVVGPDVIGYTFLLNPMVLFLATVPNIFSTVLGSKPFAYLGRISICLYFWHTPLQELFRQLGTILTGSGTFTDTVFFIYLLTLFPVCILIYQLFRKKNLI